MSYSIFVPNGILTMVETDFNCPNCQQEYSEDFYYKALFKNEKGLIYKKCRKCGSKMGITTDIRGDVKVWLKQNEHESRKNIS
jgi:hypothetical protein